jgi:hypothetical protein
MSPYSYQIHVIQELSTTLKYIGSFLVILGICAMLLIMNLFTIAIFCLGAILLLIRLYLLSVKAELIIKEADEELDRQSLELENIRCALEK